ncbi:MAG: hypothetical protein ACOX6S_14635 [Clostridia bacterium]|jgi:hypothetical protein
MYIGSVRFYKHLIYFFLIATTVITLSGLLLIGGFMLDTHYTRLQYNRNFSQIEMEEYSDADHSLVTYQQ